jgi:UDP-N-acetylglucosamine 3-dehydrogenase
MTSKLRIAVIGLGSMGSNHLRVLLKLPDVEVTGVADADAERVARATANQPFPGFPDAATLLAESTPQAVTVVVPTQAHEEVVTQAFAAGADVLVEKPIAGSLAAGRRMARAAEEAGRTLAVGHIVRFNPAVEELRRRMQEGQGGRVLQLRTRRLGPFPHRIRDVGVIHDLAIHDIDLMRFLLDDDIERVYAEAQSHINTSREDLVTAIVHFRSGTVGSLEVNWLTPVKERSLHVLCEGGMFAVDGELQTLAFYENFDAAALPGTLSSVTEGPMTKYPIEVVEPLQTEIERFVDGVRNGTAPAVSADDGLAALAVAEAMVRSAACGEPVAVEDIRAGA